MKIIKTKRVSIRCPKEEKMFRYLANLYHKFWSWSHTEIGDGILCFILMLIAMLAGIAILIYGYVTGFEG